MLHKTQGIVLNTINYSDKYILAPIYTNMFGRVTYMIPKTKGKSSKVQKSLFSPMSILDLEVEHQYSKDIQRVREAQNAYPLFSIPTNMVKTSVVFFLSEFLNRILKDTDEHQMIFNYLNYSIQVLEQSEKGLANYHIVFMLKLSQFLGFYPNFEDYNKGDIFDMLNGIYVSSQPLHRHFVNRTESETLAMLARINYENMHHFLFSQQDRVNIVNRMLEYYRIHLHDFPTIKSTEILHELF